MYNPATNTWTLLSKISTSQVHESEYPFSYLVPNGDVFTIGPSEDNSHLLDPVNQTWTPVGGASGILNGSSVMYRPGQILYSGGAASVDPGYGAHATTSIIDLTAASPAWHQTSPMLQARMYHTLTMLADGTVLAVGGEPQSDQHTITTGVMPTEIWNPTSQIWTAAAPISAARNYHSTAVLMPDGRVFVAGGGHPDGLNDPGQYSQQIYSPSYLFAGPRPTISGAPSSGSYGSSITVTTPDSASIGSVNLVSLGADTHQIDMDQHFVPLQFTTGLGSLQVQMPASGALAPPGHYMLFIVGTNGVPSVASIISVGASVSPSAPGAPTGVSATAANASATVQWTAPASGSAAITSYTVTPYVGGTAQTPTSVNGTPPSTSTTVTGLTNGTSYTFEVTATNSVGTGPSSAASNSVVPSAVVAPSFVQKSSTVVSGKTTATTTLPGTLTHNDRTIVEVATWSTNGDTTTNVTDTAGNTYSETTHFTASDGTEMSVWTAPAGTTTTKPTITATTSAKADIGILALDYTGLSAVNDTTVVDQQTHATGTTTTAGPVSAGPTQPATSTNELTLGLYADSGFADHLTGTTGTTRVNNSPNSNIELLAQDQPATTGATPTTTTTTGANTIWLAATLILRAAPSQPAPSAAAIRTAPEQRAPATGPAFVQSAGAHTTGTEALQVTTRAPAVQGDRLVVEVGTWSGAGSQTAAVSDRGGDHFVEVTAVTASDGTQLSVWSAPVGRRAGPDIPTTVTVSATSAADIGVVVSEYSGLSAAAGAGAIDVTATASGTTGSPVAVSSGSTTAAASGLAVGFYADRGASTGIGGAPGYAVRSNLSPASDIQLLSEDVTVAAGAAPAASATTSSAVTWSMATVVFRRA